MEIEFHCSDCKQPVCTCNVRCPGCGSLLNKENKYISITLKAEVDANGIRSVSDETDRGIVDEVLGLAKRVRNKELKYFCSDSEIPTNMDIIFNFTEVKSAK
jgi:hypothetical protein